ncbi:hypothetical protein [Amantichitinum ursilacus]|uniref:Uncharacterized protein n=1 Tax=Amantichitinum ursilacus TaxID=857265 RepID=A0A0N0XKC4_9NEIS|nr:hypothetical protein [Amantichitinum ursilacus]KPC54486.1 hypothetical protein WG78_02890 [Amantichitinum ursilacus]
MFDFKGLVGALLNRREQDGVYDFQSATQLMQVLPESDILQAQIEIVKALRQMNANGDISLKERLRTVPYLDEKARHLQRHLVDVCEGNILDETASPQQVLPTMLAFWQEMGDAYRVCIKQALATKARNLDKQLHLFCLRGMSYYVAQARWCYLRYLDLESRTWRSLHRLYTYAEQGGYVGEGLAAYEDAPFSDVRSEYLQAMMLSLAQPDKMQPVQISMTAQFLKRWSGLLEIESEIRPNHQLFGVNIGGATPPKRLRRDMVGENWRYWSTDALVLKMREAAQRLEQGGSPAAMGLRADTGTEANVQLLTHLANMWCREIPAPIRKYERRIAQKPIHVVRGLEEIIQFLRGTRPDSGMGVARWELENESDGGIGITYRIANDDKLLVGEIVCMSGIGNKPFTIGTIRRINRSRDGEVHVGIETLSQSPVAVELTSLPDQRRVLALYCPDSVNPAPGRFLIVPQHHADENREFRLSAQGKAYRIRLAQATERGPRTAIAQFSVLEKIAA